MHRNMFGGCLGLSGSQQMEKCIRGLTPPDDLVYIFSSGGFQTPPNKPPNMFICMEQASGCLQVCLGVVGRPWWPTNDQKCHMSFVVSGSE